MSWPGRPAPGRFVKPSLPVLAGRWATVAGRRREVSRARAAPHGGAASRGLGRGFPGRVRLASLGKTEPGPALLAVAISGQQSGSFGSAEPAGFRAQHLLFLSY